MSTPKSLTVLVQSFFGIYLRQEGFSPLTMLSYRDTLKLLLRYAAKHTGRRVVKLHFTDVDKALVKGFLTHLETERGNQISTRNNRLAAVRSFFQFVAEEEPSLAHQCTKVCEIRMKKAPTRDIDYLDLDEMHAILDAPNRSTLVGRRHYATVLFLYNAGARVDELINVKATDLQLTGSYAHVLLVGKGRKERRCPLWKQTATVLRDLLEELEIELDSPRKVFLNARGKRISRFGVDYIVKKYTAVASEKIHSLRRKKVSPHCVRHTTAVHLLNAGVDINVIRSWLGHVDIKTTNIYAEIDRETKRNALEACAYNPSKKKRRSAWKRADVLDWLEKYDPGYNVESRDDNP